MSEYQSYVEQGYNFLPVMRRLVADDLTPVGVLGRLRDQPNSFLFESVVGGESQARYSFAGYAPSERLVGDLNSVSVTRADGSTEVLAGDPYAAVRTYMTQFKTPRIDGVPRFSGGLVGYFGYDTVRLLEQLPDMPEDVLGLPDLHLARYDTIIAFDHSFNHILLIAHADLRHGEALEDALAAAEARLDTVEACIQEPAALGLIHPQAATPLTYTQHTTRERYEETVCACQEYIKAGDIFQVVPSQRLSADISTTPFQIYRSVRSLNPSPYLFCLQFDHAGEKNALVGASPEIMVRVDDGRVTVRPIAGTIGRGVNEAEDALLAQQLLADPKERAEHVMLIDLGRNDVGRVSQPSSVELVEQMVIEKYSHVQHIVSHVEGDLRTDMDALDALRHCHPAGTVSGAPKIRAMEIIDQMEPVKRGPYAGAVGYLDFNGNLDTCIALRTAVVNGNKVHVQAGAGVVADSNPASEYEETMKKAQAMLQAIARADQF